MDWRTILAVAISVVLIIAVPLLIPVIFPGDKAARRDLDAGTGDRVVDRPRRAGRHGVDDRDSPAVDARRARGVIDGDAPSRPEPWSPIPPAPLPPDTQPARVVRETDTLILTFETAGADVSSIKLKEYRNVDGSPVELVLAGASAERPFALAFGDYLAAPETGPFVLREYCGRRAPDVRVLQGAALGRRACRSP